VVLLSSGVTVTYCHYSIIRGNLKDSLFSLILTVFLGFYFTFLQASEYFETSFSISDGIYGSTFFVATGFHGAHVIIGSIFLILNVFRLLFGHYRINHHFGFEAAAWY
jgi:cytochrome c oxidase subunit 3